MGKDLQEYLIKILGARTICFNEKLRYMLNSVNSAIFLHKLLWWYGKSGDPEWIFKTAEECEEETTLTTSQQDTAIKKLVDLGIIEYKVKGIPPIRHFKLNKDKIIECCLKYTESLNPSGQNNGINLVKSEVENGEKEISEVH